MKSLLTGSDGEFLGDVSATDHGQTSAYKVTEQASDNHSENILE